LVFTTPTEGHNVATTFATLLVGTDGSADADRAVQWTAEMAGRPQAKVVVVHAVPLLDHLPGEDDVIASTVRREVEARLVGEWTEPLRRRDVTYRCVMEDGPPLMAIPSVAVVIVPNADKSNRRDGEASAL